MNLSVRAPLRIDFAGGWTDVPTFAEDEGGAVVNAAITHYVTGNISRPDQIRRLWGSRQGSRVEYTVDLPSGSGLGTSAAQTVAWVTLVRSSIANTASRIDIAEMACEVASALGIVGGKQDEYASALGGIHYFSFGDRVQAERLELPASFLADLRSRLVLVYTGASRFSAQIHEKVWDRYRERSPAVMEALRGLKKVAGEMRVTLEQGDIDQFASLLTANWRYQTALDPEINPTFMQDVFLLAAQSGAVGGKACGAGGGGCAVFVARSGETQRLESALRHHGLKTIDVDFDTFGVYLRKG